MVATIASHNPARRSLRDLISRGGERVLHGGAWRLRHGQCVWALVQRQLSSTVRTPVRVRPQLWRHGFLSEAWVIYDLARNDWRHYVSDYDRFTRTRLINGRYAAVLDNKLMFESLLGGLGLTPRFHGVLEKGCMLVPTGKARPVSAAKRVRDVLRRDGALVLKPLTGGGGRGLMMLRDNGDSLTCNHAPIDEADLRRFAETCENYMACELVAQHAAFARLYAKTTNSLRIVTMYDEDCGPFIAAAVLRIGNDESAPREAWQKGGLCANVDVESGGIGPAVRYPANSDRLNWFTAHPDTGAVVEGGGVPHWERVCRELLDLSRSLPVLKYVGWDVVVTEDGFRILEGNNYPDVNLLQVHRPLLADRRVRKFFGRYGIGHR